MHDLSLAKKFVWLLRSDITKNNNSRLTDEDYFENWWLINGRSEYPYWSYLDKSQKQELFQPIGKLSVSNVELSIPKIMQDILTRRQDVVVKYTVDKKVNQHALLGWFWIVGIKEHSLIEAVTLDSIRQLDKTIILDPTSKFPNPDDVPSPTALITLAWFLLEPSVQSTMNIQIPEQRYRYFGYFFVWLCNIFNFQNLISNRWKSWLLQEIPANVKRPDLGDLPRFALLEHTLTQPKNRPDLETEEGIKSTRLWSNQSLNTGAKWAWLKKRIDYNDDGLPTLQSLGITDIFIKSDDHETSPNIRGEFGVNLFGFAYGELGVGEDVRMAAMACDNAGIPYRIVNIAPGKEIRQADIGLKTKVDESALNAPYKINIFCMPGFDTAARIFLKLGEKVFKNHYNIGWWPWELSNWPKGWEAAFHLVDEVWAGSEFSYGMYSKALKQFEVKHGLKKSCSLVPLAVSIDRLTNSKIKYSKKYFGLPEKSFLFLYAFDFSSHLKRKNPTALVHAFNKAFPPNLKTPNPPVGLILKVMNVNPKDPTWIELENLCSQDPRIHLLIKTLDRPEVLGLIKVCDAYVSPHRAEGFGRTLAEAMLMGKPVVATNYSGNTFFMHPEYTLPVEFDLEVMDYGDYHFITKDDEAVWASPNIDHLAFQLQKAVEYGVDPEFFKNVINYAEQLFSPEKIGKKMIARLREINL